MDTERLTDYAYLALRVVAGFMYFQVGSAILFGWFGGVHFPAGTPAPTLLSEVGVAAVLEFGGGILVLLGLFTRPAAFIVSGEMAVGYWQMHAPHGGWPFQNEGVAAVLYCFIFLYLAARGGGAFSLDALLRRNRDAMAAKAIL
ncbi:MAG TPA: DoxX family protein [Gammaproteobacteria bacterium]|nr:DoxX family protein [Gammaproteobacteria bacterium]